MPTPSTASTGRDVGRDGDRTETVPLDSGRQLVYTEYGCPSGVPVLFLHGTPGSRTLAKLFDAAAAEREIRLLAPDRPGFGRSTPWPDRTIRDAGTYVSAVLDDAGVEAAGMVAFSGGAPEALATATTHGSRVDRVDIVAGATPPSVSEETPATQRLLSGLATAMPFVLRGLFRGQAWLANHIDPSFVVAQYTSETAETSVPDAAAEIVREDFVEAFARHRRGAVTEFRNMAQGWGIDFAGIEADVCFWHGDADTNAPTDDVRRLEAEIPAAQLTVVDGADHLTSLLDCTPDVLEAHR